MSGACKDEELRLAEGAEGYGFGKSAAIQYWKGGGATTNKAVGNSNIHIISKPLSYTDVKISYFGHDAA